MGNNAVNVIAAPIGAHVARPIGAHVARPSACLCRRHRRADWGNARWIPVRSRRAGAELMRAERLHIGEPQAPQPRAAANPQADGQVASLRSRTIRRPGRCVGRRPRSRSTATVGTTHMPSNSSRCRSNQSTHDSTCTSSA